VAQAGSLVNDQELRFDFSHFEKLSPEQLVAVEDFANQAILADHPVTTDVLPLDKATQTGAIGLFEEEYRGKSEVRVVSVDDVSKELCGGTHTSRSGEIGLFKIVAEESIASGTRRIRAVTGDGVVSYLREQEAFREAMRSELGEDPVSGAAQLKSHLEELSSQVEELVGERIQKMGVQLSANAAERQGIRVVASRVDLPGDQLKQLADVIEANVQPAVVILAGESKARALVVCKVSKSVKNVRAGDVVKSMSQALGGGGGGAPTFAQGGGQDVDKIDTVLASASEDLLNALT
jgi:alanyl-tRNA synthetase